MIDGYLAVTIACERVSSLDARREWLQAELVQIEADLIEARRLALAVAELAGQREHTNYQHHLKEFAII